MIEAICPRCPCCGNQAVLTLDAKSYFAWAEGAYIQDAFPSMSPSEREMLLSGIHPECWSAAFPDEELEDWPSA